MRRAALALLLLASTGVPAPTPPTTTPPKSWARSVTSVMFQHSTSTSNVSYAGFMCPGLVAIRGHLLAFAEGRNWACADFGHHDLVMRLSRDDGRTWEPLRTLLDPNTLPGCNMTEACLPYTEACQGPPGSPGNRDGKNATVCGGGCAVWDPTPVVDEVTGEVHVLFGRSTTSCVPGPTYNTHAAGQRADLWIMTSRDLGATWSAARNVTAECSTPYGGGVTGSEGKGIQLSSGELIVPLYNVPTAGGGQGLCISKGEPATPPRPMRPLPPRPFEPLPLGPFG